MTDDRCGHPTQGGDGPPCQNPATEGDSCWIEAHGGHVTGHGRDPKLTKERQEQIAGAIEQGKSIVSACRMAGIDRATFYNWMDRGETEDETVYGDFFDRIVRARGYSENRYFETIFDLARQEGDLATLMSMLKQRHPDAWGEVDRGQQSGGVVIHTGDPDEFEIDEETLEAERK